MQCYKCGGQIPENSLVCLLCGTEMSQRARAGFQSGGANYGMHTQYTPMNWFKFLIYFMLFADAVISVTNAYGFITGSIYSVISAGEYTAADIYGKYGVALRIADMLYAACLIIFAVLTVVARYRLAGFKKDGPVYLYVAYTLSIVFSLAYAIAENIIMGIDYQVIASAVVSMIPQAVFVYLNYLYFKKRKHLFVN